MDRRRNPLADPAPFREWLEEKPVNFVTGRCGIPDGCPLAWFVREYRGDSFVVVGVDGFAAEDQHFAMPKWARAFVERVDSWGRKGTVVRADRALTLLRDIEQEQAGGS